jgi:hypothetical protein
MSITQIRLTRRYGRAAAGAAVAVALGGLVAGCGSSGSTAATTTSSGPAAATAGTTQTAPPGLGKTVTGTAAAKAKAAALAKYPGTVERVMQLGDGSFLVHVIRSSGGEVHVKVSKSFTVTGTEQGPPAGGAPPSGAGRGTTTAQS